MTLDRIIFLRICEDRGIEPYGQLQNLLNHPDIYESLVTLYRKADQRYNSGLFHFKRESDRPDGHDDWTPKLIVDDKVLKDIFKGLYYPESPYEFSVIPVEILGQVYERFLGKVIRLTAGRHVRIEEKPEVKKAGGVYYTPSYIEDYIVKNTVGKLLEGKTVKKAEKLRVLDPACGSGSFLLGAYFYSAGSVGRPSQADSARPLCGYLEWIGRAGKPDLRTQRCSTTNTCLTGSDSSTATTNRRSARRNFTRTPRANGGSPPASASEFC